MSKNFKDLLYHIVTVLVVVFALNSIATSCDILETLSEQFDFFRR